MAAAHQHSRYQHIGLAIRLGLQVRHNGKLGDVISGIAHDLLEQIVGNLHFDKIEINQNYSKSDTLQVMRLLKNYDLLKDTQLDLPGTRDIASSRRKVTSDK